MERRDRTVMTAEYLEAATAGSGAIYCPSASPFHDEDRGERIER
jgi:hypothetical protein